MASKGTAPSKGMSVVPGPLAVGDLLAGRYRLLEAVGTDGPAVLWRARDEVLARSVAVKVIPTPNKAARAAAQPFLDAAARTGAVNHPGLVRVYDAALEPRPGRGTDVAYVIREWVDGEALDVHLAGVGPLAARDASDVVRQAADALSAAHTGGLVHGRLHPRNVIVTASGRVRLTDAAIAAAVHSCPVPAHAGPADVALDTRDLAALLYALVTGRWPGGATDQPSGNLAAAPLADGHPLSPRQLRGGVPRALDHVITRGLDPSRLPTLTPLTTPAALADAADASVAEAREAQVHEATPTPPSRLRRAWPWVAAATFVTVVGIAGWLLGLAVGDLPRRASGVDAIVSTTAGPSPGAPGGRPAAALDLSRVAIRDFDPEGDKQENPDQVRNAVDGVPGTAWATDLYRTATFGGLKQGVGLLLDLGKVTRLHTVQVGFSAPGAHMQLRVSKDPPTDAASLQSVAAANGGGQVATLTPTAGTTARYVLIWLTSLPKDGSGYRIGISELRIT
ncbi:MAG: serine/threonine protein kinase [Frankiales bacterium]|nr:serine/threonine protein kinase [Frankiales bacterium]